MASATAHIYHFGRFRLDLAARKLWCEGEILTPSLKVFDCIAYLVEHRERPVGRDELIEAIWGHSHLAENTLDQVIRRARQMLGDTGSDQRMIETVRGFGYQWGAPVEMAQAPERDAPEHTQRPDAESARSRARSTWIKAMAAALGLVIVAAGTAGYFWKTTEMRTHRVSAPDSQADAIALLLPVAVESDGNHAWARLGVMALIAERLRAAGQTMVSGDTVIALLHGADQAPDDEAIERLVSTTGAGLVLEATASIGTAQWRVSLRSIEDDHLSLAVIGEGHDILEAAQNAADAMASVLGLQPSGADLKPEPEPGMRLLLQQIEAARLAQQMDVARKLIEQADTRLRQHPEVRFQLARLDYFSHNLDAAYATFEALLGATPADRDGEFRARILNGLAAVYFRRREPDAAQAVLEEAGSLVSEDTAPAVYSAIWHSLGVVALSQSRFDTARKNLARARRGYVNAGDAAGLALLNVNRGVLEAVLERPDNALRYFTQSATVHAALRDFGSELLVRTNMIEANLARLDLQAASEILRRIEALNARVANPVLVAKARLAKIALLEAGGQYQAAKDLLGEVLVATQGEEGLRGQWLIARALQAEQRLREGDPGEAVRVAGEVVSMNASGPGRGFLSGDRLGRVRRTLVRGYLAQRDGAGAQAAIEDFAKWAEGSQTLPPKIYAALAHAEWAALEGHDQVAASAYEQALTLAESSGAPLRLLQVAESYIPWLLSKEAPDLDRALVVAEPLERHADQYFSAALLELQVYHATGTSPGWQAALARAQSLAGEREIPPALLSAP